MDDALPPLSADPLPTFKDKKTGLVVFGIFEVLLGCLAGLLICLVIFGQFMMARETGEAPQLRMIVPTAAFYGTMAIVLIALGIGSMRKRRWARALSLVLSWTWLGVGVVALATVIFVMPKIMRSAMGQAADGPPPQALLIATVAAASVVGLFFVLVPGILVLFYQSRHVKATCEARDPKVRWTDACPLPVLGLCLWLGVAAGYMLLMPFCMNGVIPVFGVLLSGKSGSLAYFILAGLWVYCAFAVYQLEPAGWWLVLVSLCVMSTSALISFSRIGLPEMYQQMGYSQAQIQMMNQFGFMDSSSIGYLSAAATVPLLIYLLCVKRYFRPATAT